MKLRIVADKREVSIGTEGFIENDDFAYAFYKNMYGEKDGVGLQVNDESNRPQISNMCNKISAAIMEYMEE